MNTQELKKIVDLFDNSDAVKLSLKEDNFELKLEKASATAQKMVEIGRASCRERAYVLV